MSQQLEMFTLPNPCRGLCQTNSRGYCKGCYRSREERFGWQTFNDAEKHTILRLCTLRRRAAHRPHATPHEEVILQGELF